jgi:hypothetical protein
MPRMSLSCDRKPAEYFKSKRSMLSDFSVCAILRATVSGAPTCSAPCATSCSNEARAIGGQPRSVAYPITILPSDRVLPVMHGVTDVGDIAWFDNDTIIYVPQTGLTSEEVQRCEGPGELPGQRSNLWRQAGTARPFGGRDIVRSDGKNEKKQSHAGPLAHARENEKKQINAAAGLTSPAFGYGARKAWTE